MAVRQRRNGARFVVIVAAFVAASTFASAAVAAGAAVKPPPGAAKPIAGSGIGTTAALNNPKCTHDDAAVRRVRTASTRPSSAAARSA